MASTTSGSTSRRGSAETNGAAPAVEARQPVSPLRRISVDPPMSSIAARRSSRAEKYDSPHLGPPKMKILLLGDSATGKSAVTQRFVNGKFDPEHKPTVAVDFSQTTVTVGTQLVRLALWNLAEKKEGTQLVNSNHFMGVHGALIVTDVAQPHTIARMVQWKGLVDNTVAETCSPPIGVVVLANKADRIGEEGVNFHKSQLEKLCKKCHVDAWFATSAKSGANVELAIKEVVRLALTGPYASNFQAITQSDLDALCEDIARLKAERMIQLPVSPLDTGKQQQQQQDIRRGDDFAILTPRANGGVQTGCRCTVS